jgi:hypothetical protein
MGKRGLHLMGTINAKKRWKTGVSTIFAALPMSEHHFST